METGQFPGAGKLMQGTDQEEEIRRRPSYP
jgi:hypothetical protein